MVWVQSLHRVRAQDGQVVSLHSPNRYDAYKPLQDFGVLEVVLVCWFAFVGVCKKAGRGVEKGGERTREKERRDQDEVKGMDDVRTGKEGGRG